MEIGNILLKVTNKNLLLLIVSFHYVSHSE